MRSQIEVMDEGVLFVSYVDECRVESGHDLTYLAQVDIPHGETRLALLLVELDQHLIFAQSNGYLSGTDVYD